MKLELKNNRFLTFLLIIGLFLFFFLPPTDPDLGWHLRCGQQIWQKGNLCSQNTFSVLMENYLWADVRALYQLLIYPFYRLFGLFGLSLINSFLMLASLVFFLSLSGKKGMKIISLPLVIFLSWTVLGFGIRNQLLSFFYFLVLLKLIELANQNKMKWFFLSPLIMLLWANSHGGFIIGLILLFIFLLEKTIWLITRQQFKNYLPTLGIILLSIGATFFNPFNLKIYFEAWRHFYTVPLAKLIAEWVPPNPSFQILILLFFISGVGFIFRFKKQNLLLFKLLVLTALAIFAFKARRNLSFFFIFFAYLLASVKLKLKFEKKIIQPLALLSILAIFSFGLFFQLPKTLFINSNWDRFCQSGHVKYPCQAVEFLKSQSEKGNIFNRYEWGGFLIWQLPEYKIFVDGRMPAWPTPSGKSPYTIYLETLQTQPGWEETLDKYNINWILISPGTFMDLKLRPNPEYFGWQEVYRDEISAIFKRT